MNVIDIKHLTKDYGAKKGIFDVSLTLKEGEVYGYLGPNGAGKTTTIRHLMGFIKPQSGSAEILGMDCWSHQKQIQKHLGYLPGEIAFPEDMTGLEYLKLIAKMRGMNSFDEAKRLLDFFEINPNLAIRKMSKGMKQKIGITSAFMHNPDILLLDEPTSGLDPLMQNKFIELIKEKKDSGRTIIISSHVFEEVEKTCHTIGMIKGGKLIKEAKIDEITSSRLKRYTIGFKGSKGLSEVMSAYPNADYNEKENQITVCVNDCEINRLILELSKCNVKFLKEEKYTLEEYFMQFYGGNDNV